MQSINPGINKLVVIICMTILAITQVKSQSWCVSAEPLLYIQHYPEKQFAVGGSYDTLQHLSPFTPGLRVEINYLLPGFNFPVSGFNGGGLAYFFPKEDSALLYLKSKNGDYLSVVGTQKTRIMMPEFRFGYEIPQTFDDFLMIHFGWSLGGFGERTRDILPEKSVSFPYTADDFDPNELRYELTAMGFSFGLFAGVTYEFEHFYILGQYSAYYLMDMGGNELSQFRHGLTLGICLPFKRK